MAEFDPNQPYEAFDPSQPFEVVPDIDRLTAAGDAINKGLTYNTVDELQGLEAASGMPRWAIGHTPVGAARLAYEKLAGRGEATEAYEKTTEAARKRQKAGAEKYPYMTTGLELAGGLASPLLIAPPVAGAKLGQLAAWGAKAGAVTGAASGFGEGEGLADSAAKAQTNALIGTALGSIAAPAVGATVNKIAGRAWNEPAKIAGQVAEKAPEVPAEPDYITKMTQALRTAGPLREEQAVISSKIRSDVAGNLARIQQEMPGEEGIAAQFKAMVGKHPTVDFPSIRNLLTQENITDMFKRINLGNELQPFEKVNAITGLEKMLGEHGGTVPTKSELNYLSKVFPQDFVDAALENRGALRYVIDEAGDILNIPRAMMASVDLSAPFRQGWGMVGRKEFYPAFRDMFKYAASDDFYKAMEDGIRAGPNYAIKERGGLAIMDVHAISPTRHEEQFMSNYAHHIPGIGKIIGASDRAFTGVMTKIRSDVFDDLWAKAGRLGVLDDPTRAERVATDLSEYINTFTGRGTMSFKTGQTVWSQAALEKTAPILNGIFFSPRLMASRVQMLNPQFYYKLDPFVRKEALRDAITSSGAAASVMGLAAMAGANIVMNPLNSDFLKIKVGNTRYDVMGGLQPYMVLAARLSPEFMGGGKAISSTSGRTRTYGEGYKPETRWDAWGRFFESKEAPVASFLHSAFKGQGFLGRDFNLPSEIIKRTTPMMLQDAWELSQEWGQPLGTAMAAPGFFGAGSQTYGKVQFEEGKNKAGFPAGQIAPPPDWGEYAAEHAGRPWKAIMGNGEVPKGTSKRYDIDQFLRNNYTKMSPEERTQFSGTLDKYPALRKRVLEVNKDIQNRVTPQEFDMKVRGVEDGTRALAIKKELESLPTYEEKKKLWNRYREINVITDPVEEQLNTLKARPKIDPTNTIPKKDQKEIDKALDSIPRAYGGRVYYRAEGGRTQEKEIKVGLGRYTPEEIRASDEQNTKFFQAMNRLSARLAPRGVPEDKWRRMSKDLIEDRRNENQGEQLTPIPPELIEARRQAPNSPKPPVTPLSVQAGYYDIGRRRGGKIKLKRVPPQATIPESAATLKRQQQGLIGGQRKAMLFPYRGSELALPKGMRRMKTRDGLLHFNPKLLKPSQIKAASEKGKMNDLLGMGPVTKEEALARQAKGELPLAVTERGPDGVEVKAAAGTDVTAPEQIAAMQEEAMPGSVVDIEPVSDTLAQRLEYGGPIQFAHHEQSETVQNEKGEWVNIYGRKTPKAGQQLPDTPVYPTVDEAVDAAHKRSEDYGREHPEHQDPEFRRGGRQKPIRVYRKKTKGRL